MAATLLQKIDLRRAEHFSGEFHLRNACVTFHQGAVGVKSSYRSQFISLDGLTAMLHGFSEHSLRFGKISTVRPARRREIPMLMRDCVRRRLGLAVYFSSNNFGHQITHAVPAHAALHASASTSNAAVFIPVVGYLAGQWTSPPHWRAAAWEYTLRSLTTLSAERLAEQLGAVLTARCTCFDSIEGSIGAYTPYSQWHGTARLGSAWRAATLRNAALVRGGGRPLGGSEDILYLARESGNARMVVNSAQLDVALGNRSRVVKVVMERLALVDQMRQVEAAVALVGVHGMALSLLPFLPYLTRRTAVLEIRPRGPEKSWLWTLIYPDWCASLGIRHSRVTAEPSPVGCGSGGRGSGARRRSTRTSSHATSPCPPRSSSAPCSAWRSGQPKRLVAFLPAPFFNLSCHSLYFSSSSNTRKAP
jgi:hypothetical protein